MCRGGAEQVQRLCRVEGFRGGAEVVHSEMVESEVVQWWCRGLHRCAAVQGCAQLCRDAQWVVQRFSSHGDEMQVIVPVMLCRCRVSAEVLRW